jgi:hypothetical protein
MRDQEIIGLYEAYHQVYAPQELTEEVEIAAQYFYEMGLNEDGVDILIEDLGVEEFADWVYEIAEDYTLTEARAGGSRIEPVTAKGQKFKSGKPTGKSLERLRAQKAARREAENKASESKPSGLKSSLQRQSAVANAQKKQPEKSGSPKGIAGRIGAALGGAVKRAKSDIELTKKTAQTVGKAVGTGIEALNRASDTRLARQGRVATKQGFKRQQKAMTAAGGALGKLAAKSSAVRDTFKAGQKLGNALRREEVESWVNALVEEGYDLSEYTWEDMTEMYLNESGWHRRNPDQIGSSNDPDVRMRPERSSSSSSSSDKKPTWTPLNDKKEYRRIVYNNYGETGRKDAVQRAKNTRDALRKKRRENGSGNEGGTQKESFDLFDTILEYLVAEGYADTNESALVIMANMSEEWKQSIVEETKRTEYLQKKFNKENEIKSGSAHTYIPGKQNTGSALQKARQSERHMRGESKEEPQKPFTGEGPKKPKGWKPTGPKLKTGQRPGYAL